MFINIESYKKEKLSHDIASIYAYMLNDLNKIKVLVKMCMYLFYDRKMNFFSIEPNIESYFTASSNQNP